MTSQIIILRGPQVQKGKFAISLSKGSEPQSLDSAKDWLGNHGEIMGKSWVALCDVNGSCKKPTRSPRISESQRFHKLQGSLDHLCKTLLNQSWKERTCPDNFRCFKQQLSVVSEMSQAHC